jgi:phage protein D
MTEQSLSQSTVYAAAPTIRVDGQANDKVTALVTYIRMAEAEGGLSSLELRFDNIASQASGSDVTTLAFEDESVLKLGSTINVYGGDETHPQEIFRGIVTGIEGTFSDTGAPELVVLAEDALQKARMARRTKVHDDATLAGLLQDLASQLGLTPQINGLSASIGRHVQYDESDLAFVRRLMALYDADMQVVADELHASARSDVQRGTVELDLYSQLRRVRVLADLAHQATAVVVAGWDASQGQAVESTATGTNWGPGSGRKGPDQLRQAIGERSEHLGHTGATTSDEAQAIATAAFDRRARRFVCAEGTAIGNPALRVGTLVKLSGMSKRFDNTYYVVRAVHRYDKTVGYETDFWAESAYFGSP